MTAWLADTLVATTGLMLLVLVLREPVRRQFGAGAAYALWLVPAARIAMPTLTSTVERTVAPPPAIEPLPLALAAAPPAPPEPSLLDSLGGLADLALWLWFGGAALMLGHGLLIYRRQRRHVLGSAVQLARLGSIRIVRSEAVRGPLAFGILDRVIALPVDFDARFDAAQRRLALDHELAHHRSGDLVANLVAYVLLCLQWFNPLAWVSHAAFRFDQEAACDARVLDKAKGPDRAAYGQAIAKAASGRALLFSGALDRPTTLKRRLSTMLTNTTPARRLAGKVVVVAALGIALPMTASRAIHYIDIPAAPAPAAAPAPMLAAAVQAPAAVAPVAPVAAIQPVAPAAPALREDRVTINGTSRHWDDLTPAERAEIRRELAHARAELRRVDMDEVRRDVREAMAEAKVDHEEIRRELAEAKADIDEAMREIDANADELRRAGQDPEAIKASVRAGLASIDPDAIARSVRVSVNEHAIRASLKAAEAGLRHAERELERLDRRTRD
jgi:bla regulator protein BlaR1